MFSALQKVDRKFLIMIGIIIGLPIFVIVFLIIFRSCSNSKITYEEYEQKMKKAATTYFSEKELNKMSEGETLIVDLSELVSTKKIKSSEDILDDTSCKGSVTVRKNGSTVEEGGFFNYTVNLECDNYKTKTLKDSLMESLTSTDAGLYKINNEYIFKGENVKNYINFFDVEYRIVSVDENGILKLLKSEKESLNRYWDVKYNTEVNDASGKNIYKDSSILQELTKIYKDSKKFPKAAREHLIAKDICVDSRDINDLSKNKKTECNVILEDQVISLINVEDFASASLDPECFDIKSKSCRNYNYLHKLHLSTWTYTAVSSNTYEVYYLSNGIIDKQKANKYSPFNLVIYIDGNEIPLSGNGLQSDPFVIK